MLLDLDTRSGVPIYRQILDQVRQQIVAGQIGEGSALESVRDLAARLKVNPMTISKAYALLENEGLLERRRGIGLFVARLGPEHRRRAKLHIVEELLKKAAVAAVQFGVSEEDARELLGQFHQQFQNRKENKKDE